MRLFLIAVIIPVLISAQPERYNPFKSAQKWIDLVNNDPDSTWTAGHNFNSNLPATYVNKLMGLKKRNGPSILPKGEPITDIDDSAIPKEFDSRQQWKNCKALQTLRDQGDCGSCWAVAAASAFTDRLCIATNAKWNSQLSAAELLSCCTECGDGCNGGYDDAAWTYFKDHGIVTGGDYKSKLGCQPYPLKTCEHHVQGPRPSCPSLDPVDTPACHKKCTNKAYKNPFSHDHHSVKTSYSVSSTVSDIQKELLKHGPVEAGFEVHEDFLTYKSGVYQPKSTSPVVGGHAVKLIGWGVEKKTPYWLVQNSWNSDWGEKGLFKILRGHDTCGFESSIYAGIPLVKYE